MNVPTDYYLKSIDNVIPRYFLYDHRTNQANWIVDKPLGVVTLCKFYWRCYQNKLLKVYLCSTHNMYLTPEEKLSELNPKMVSLLSHQMDCSFRKKNVDNVINIVRTMFDAGMRRDALLDFTEIVCKHGIVTRSFTTLIWWIVALSEYPRITIDQRKMIALVRENVGLGLCDYSYREVDIRGGTNIPSLINHFSRTESIKDPLWALHLRKDYCRRSDETVCIDMVICRWILRIMKNDPMTYMLYHSEGHPEELAKVGQIELCTNSVRTDELWNRVSHITHLHANTIRKLTQHYRDSETSRVSIGSKVRPKLFQVHDMDHVDNWDIVWKAIEPVVDQEANKIIEETKS